MTIEKNTINSLKKEDAGWSFLRNDTLSNIRHTGALGVYCYLASKPNDWNICKKHLQNHFDCGRDHIDSCFKVLKELGLLSITMQRNDAGQCIGWVTLLRCKITVQIVDSAQNTENPLSGNVSRIRETQNLGKPQSGKSAPTKERIIQKKEENTTNYELPEKPSSSSFIFSATIDRDILNQKLSRDERTDQEFMASAKDHVENHSDKQFPYLQRARGLLNLLKEHKEDNVIFYAKGTAPKEIALKQKIETHEEKMKRLWELQQADRRKAGLI